MLLTAYTHLPNAKVLWGAFFVSSLAILMIQRQHTIMAFHIYFLILMKKKGTHRIRWWVFSTRKSYQNVMHFKRYKRIEMRALIALSNPGVVEFIR